MTDQDDRKPRSIELEVEVPGTPEEVWEAIATGPGISAWMHPTEVEEREGGTFSFDMGGGMADTGRVTAWEPPQRFGQEVEWSSGDAAPSLLASEWIVEARSGGTCVVRLVTSGFGAGADWDAEIEGMAEGLRNALENLRVYLTHFAGRHASWFSVFGNGSGSQDEAWAALTGALGLADAGEGARVATSGPGVPRLSGVVEEAFDGDHRCNLLVRLEEPAPGFANVTIYGDQRWANVQASLFGDDAPAAAEREGPAWHAWMDEHFPSARAD